MTEKIIPFTPAGGDQARLERQLRAAGFEPEEPNFEFFTRSEEPLMAVVHRWEAIITELKLPQVLVATSDQYDGVGIAAEATLEQVRQTLQYHFGQMMGLYSSEEQKQYWYNNPVIQAYLHRVTKERLE